MHVIIVKKYILKYSENIFCFDASMLMWRQYRSIIQHATDKEKNYLKKAEKNADDVSKIHTSCKT